KDDHPGPIGRRQIATGGDFDQSVTIRTPRMMPSRPGPRKPGHSAGVSGATGVASSIFAATGAASAAGATLALANDVSVGITAGAADDAGAVDRGSGLGSSPPWASSRCSGVGVQRQ